uniref:Uncharacterized protein n=1 Tax=Setaria italica TaxID=4555 RepID=K3ZN19_SETIT
YLVIIDDIWRWEEWEVIRKALPKDNLGCKIIMTTRVRSIAEKCETEQRAAMRLSKSVEGLSTFSYEIADLSTEIADMCDSPPFDFCPLAVICLSSAWAESHHVQGDDEEFYWARHVLYDGFLITPSLKPLVQSLCLGFDDLPVQLRTCLLYCTICPSMGYTGGLVRKWVAEGFVSQVEIAEAYFDKLVSRNLLEREQDFYYLIHPIILAFLVCKAKEDNFIAYHWGDMPNSSHAKQIRRLSLGTDRCPDEDVLSHTRSLVVCGKQSQLDGVPFKAFKKLRVLQIDESSGCTNVTELPTCIEKLQSLKNLYVQYTKVKELPREIKNLERLETLDVSGTEVTELPTWIEKLQSLKTLNVSWTPVTELPKEIGKLQHLRTLDISGSKVREISCSKDPNPLSVQVEKLMLQSGCEDVIMSQRDDLSILILFNHFGSKCEVLPVRMLRVAGRHMKVPQWVKQDLCNVCSLDIRLCKLVHEDLEFLKTQMPNLQALQLRFEVLPREPVAITDGGFSKLETFYVDCRLPRVITFGEGAMPKLKHLEFKFYTGTVSQDYYMGIKHLDSLEKVVFRCSGYYRSDSPGIREAIDVLRNEVAEHPNMITLWVNNMECKVFRSGEFEEWEKEIEKREKEVEKKRKQKRIEERLRLSTAAEGRAQRDKNNARAGIEKEIQERKRNLEIRVQRLAVTEHYYNFLSKSGLPSP